MIVLEYCYILYSTVDYDIESTNIVNGGIDATNIGLSTPFCNILYVCTLYNVTRLQFSDVICLHILI
jgi:hypothetical protein